MKKEQSWIQVGDGGKFFPFNPRPEDVQIKDIAKALSYLCRFNGHTANFYSVAQHSLLCAELLLAERQPMRVALLGLLHDASEAYFGDVPTPIKAYIPEINEIERRIETAVYEGLGIAAPTAEERKIIKRMDIALLVNEARTLTANVEDWTSAYDKVTDIIIPSELFREMDPSQIETKFLTFYYLLKNECEIDDIEHIGA